MRVATPHVPIRRWFFAAHLAMNSADLGVHHTLIRCAMGAGGFVRAKLWGHATRLDEKSHVTEYFRWDGPRQGYAFSPQAMGTVAAVVLPETRPGEQARPTTVPKAISLTLDLTFEMRVGIRLMHLTFQALPRSARRQHGPRMRCISEVIVLRWLYRRWFAPDSNQP